MTPIDDALDQALAVARRAWDAPRHTEAEAKALDDLARALDAVSTWAMLWQVIGAEPLATAIRAKSDDIDKVDRVFCQHMLAFLGAYSVFVEALTAYTATVPETTNGHD